MVEHSSISWPRGQSSRYWAEPRLGQDWQAGPQATPRVQQHWARVTSVAPPTSHRPLTSRW